MLEDEIQSLLCHHPYLLDADVYQCGRRERSVASGRTDIDFLTHEGTIVVECKRAALRDADVLQLRRYLANLQQMGEKVLRAYLVGAPPAKPLDIDLLAGDVPILVRELWRSIPLHLSLCRNGHYFDVELSRCPHCKSPGIPGSDVLIT